MTLQRDLSLIVKNASPSTEGLCEEIFEFTERVRICSCPISDLISFTGPDPSFNGKPQLSRSTCLVDIVFNIL